MKIESNALEQIKLWNKIYPEKPLQIGRKVKIHPDCEWYEDYKNDVLVIIGLCVDHHRDNQLNITIGNDLTDGGIDGWGAGDLIAV